MNHSITIQQLGEGGVQAVCSCGWRSLVFGADKTAGTMDPLQHATEAADLHEWEMSLRLALPEVWPGRRGAGEQRGGGHGRRPRSRFFNCTSLVPLPSAGLTFCAG